MDAQLTLGPALFNWPAEQWRDFYFRIADEAPVERVCIGEVVCSKRAPLFEPFYEQVAERLHASGKTVVFSTLAEVMTSRERQMTRDLCTMDSAWIEANDASALYHLRGRTHAIGPFVNVYNEDTLGVLARRGAEHFALAPELPAKALSTLGSAARSLGKTLEVQVYGRIPLALSARCYHARAHGRVKDDCRYVCEEDPDGMELSTVSGQPFLSVNGIQTLSHGCLNLAAELHGMRQAGITHFRLSPHWHDMVTVAQLFRAVLDNRLEPEEANTRLAGLRPEIPFCNGFHHGVAGHKWLEPKRIPLEQR